MSNIDAFARQLGSQLGKEFSPGSTKWVARAAVALDCMGGFAEYCGALTLTLPTMDSVYVAVQTRQDQNVQVTMVMDDRNGDPATEVFPLALWYEDDKLVNAATFARRVEELNAAWAKPVVGVLHVLLAGGHVPHWGGGLTIAVAGSSPFQVDAAVSPTITAATLAAICKCLGLDISPTDMALLGQQSQNYIMGIPTGPSAVACGLLGESGALLQLLCQPLEVVGRLTMPEQIIMLGVDCGVRHRAVVDKFRSARTAAFMGRRIIERCLETRGSRTHDWNGYLARLSASDYVDSFRDRLPTKIKGEDFIERFGQTGDLLTSINESVVYKIRSRTEHHIYENMRTHQFVERLARTGRTGEAGLLLEAGELMFASHWSYGQRCGLGSIETDRIVSSLRRRGSEAGIFGARICGLGAGGTVVVLMRDTEAAHQAVRETLAEYTQATGYQTRLMCGASDGLPSCIVQRMG